MGPASSPKAPMPGRASPKNSCCISAS
jgi:hypothetical protein